MTYLTICINGRQLNDDDVAAVRPLLEENRLAAERVRELECVIADLKAECKELRLAQQQGWKLVPVEPTTEMLIAGQQAHVEAENKINDPDAWKTGGFALRQTRAKHVFQGMLNAAPQPAHQHPDDVAVDRFADAMKAKMAKQRAKGYGGWDDPAACPTERLQQMMMDHIAKGDPVDVGNFAMMLYCRGDATAKLERDPS